MIRIIAIFIGVLALVGCKSEHVLLEAPQDMFYAKAIYSRLKEEPIPLPKVTPYNSNIKHRAVFDDGFRSGWECAISGSFLHGTFGTPVDLEKEKREIWSAGWDEGIKTGFNRWQKERQKIQNESGQPSHATMPRVLRTLGC